MLNKSTMWNHWLLFLLLVTMFVGIPSLADPQPAPGMGWLFGYGVTELPPTEENLIKETMEGNLENVKDLIERGVDVNCYRGAPLSEAAESGQMEMVRYLLAAGANPNGANETRSSFYNGAPLRKAGGNNHLDVMKLLLEAGASVYVGKYSRGIINEAAENGNLEAVKILLEAGFDPDHGGGYSLLLAAKEGHLDVVNAFIEAGANVSAGRGWIIDNAASEGHMEVVKALMEAGADPANWGGAMVEAAANGHLSIVQLMLENGVDPSYGSVLKSAAEHGDLEIVKTLLEAGSNITYDGDGGYPLHFGVIGGNPDVVALLVEYGGNIGKVLDKDMWWDLSLDQTDEYGNGWSVMHVAARWGQPMIEKLVELGAEISVRDVRGYTPLQIAIIYEKLIIAKELLRFCVDLTPTSYHGKTARDMAKEEALRNVTGSTEYKALMNFLTKVMPEKIATSPANEKTVWKLRDDFLTMLKENSTLEHQLKDVRTNASDVAAAIRYLLVERFQQNITEVIEGHNCQASLKESSAIAVGKEYLATCECIPGQGPKMTFTPIQEGHLVCDQVTTIQEEQFNIAALQD